MEDIKLIYELNFIKNEIEKDINVINKLENDLKLRDIYHNNKDLSNTIASLTDDYNLRLNELKNKNILLEKGLYKLSDQLEDKEKEENNIKEGFNTYLETTLAKEKSILFIYYDFSDR